MAKILIIDTSPFMRGSLKFLLERAGHEVIGTSDNAKESEDLYRSYRPDIVTIDVTMGGGDDGLSIMKTILNANPSVKIIMVTASGNEEIKDEARKIGVYGQIEKPYKFDAIIAELQRVTGKK